MVVINNQVEFDTIFVHNIEKLPTDEIIRIMYNPIPYKAAIPIRIYQSNIIIQGYGMARPKIMPTNPTVSGTGFHFLGTATERLENLRVEYIDIDNASGNQSGIYCNYVGKAQTTGLPNGGYDSSTVGKNKVNKIGITVKACIVQNGTRSGVWLNIECDNCKIIDNLIKNNTTANSNGVHLAKACNNIISGNTVQGSGHNGIALYDTSNNNIISNNITQNNQVNGINTNAPLCQGNVIIGNISQLNTGHGLAIQTTESSTVIGNVARANNQIGIYSGGASVNNTFTGNNIIDNLLYGITLESPTTSKNMVIMSNIIGGPRGTKSPIESKVPNALILGNHLNCLPTISHVVSTGANAKIVDNQNSNP